MSCGGASFCDWNASSSSSHSLPSTRMPRDHSRHSKKGFPYPPSSSSSCPPTSFAPYPNSSSPLSPSSSAPPSSSPSPPSSPVPSVPRAPSPFFVCAPSLNRNPNHGRHTPGKSLKIEDLSLDGMRTNAFCSERRLQRILCEGSGCSKSTTKSPSMANGEFQTAVHRHGT